MGCVARGARIVETVRSVLGVELDDVVFRIPEEQRSVPPVRQIGRAAQDRHAFLDQFGVAGINRRRRDTESELDRGRAWHPLPVVAQAPF